MAVARPVKYSSWPSTNLAYRTGSVWHSNHAPCLPASVGCNGSAPAGQQSVFCSRITATLKVLLGLLSCKLCWKTACKCRPWALFVWHTDLLGDVDCLSKWNERLLVIFLNEYVRRTVWLDIWFFSMRAEWVIVLVEIVLHKKSILASDMCVVWHCRSYKGTRGVK